MAGSSTHSSTGSDFTRLSYCRLIGDVSGNRIVDDEDLLAVCSRSAAQEMICRKM